MVTRYSPTPTGHGGNHRSYQILSDVRRLDGVTVDVLSLDDWERDHPALPAPALHHPILRAKSSFHYRWDRISRNPFWLLGPTNFTTAPGLPEAFVQEYYKAATTRPLPAACVVDHTLFDSLRVINHELGISTILCPHNLDSLSQNLPLVAPEFRKSRWRALAGMADLIAELDAFRNYEDLLLISRVEASVAASLGVDSSYYPYVPVAEIRRRLLSVRERRERGKTMGPALLVVMGSARHFPTRKSLEWFMRGIRQTGPPPGVLLEVVGHDTDALMVAGDVPNGVKLRGWLGQNDLDDLLTRARAVLIPQVLGFGTLTRLPELACAGIPVLVTAYPTYALDPPSNATVVESNPDAWFSAMDKLARRDTESVPGYEEWESRQPSTLVAKLRGYLSSWPAYV